MDPLIKWPGGKGGELDLILPRLPDDYDRYVEPFFGGGAVFFAIEPEYALINDVATDLIDLYRALQGDVVDREAFARALRAIDRQWSAVPNELDRLYGPLSEMANRVDPAGGLTDGQAAAVDALVDDYLSAARQEEAFRAGSLNQDWASIGREVRKAMRRKMRRLAKLEDEHGDFSVEDRRKTVETGVRSGLYTYWRAVLNDEAMPTRAGHVAVYYFIREFCYGSMFRYNSRGEFNVPYGGGAYNGKNFTRKVDRLLSDRVARLFRDVTIEARDFEDVLLDADLGANDVLFLDPPYDSEFSDYDDTAFGPEDHRRLAHLLAETPARFLLVIGRTELIDELYRDVPGLTVEEIDMQYSVNIRNRNERDTGHLYISNYGHPTGPAQRELLEAAG